MSPWPGLKDLAEQAEARASRIEQEETETRL